MEIALVICLSALILSLGAMCWMMWRIHCALREISKSLEVLSDGLTILVYLAAKNSPELLEHAPDLAQKALEAAERLGRKQLEAPVKQ